MINSRILSFAAASLMAIVPLTYGQTPEVKLVGNVADDAMQLKCGETAKIEFQVIGTNGVKVVVTRYADDGKSGEKQVLTPDADGKCSYESSTQVPGALMAYAKVVTDDEKPVQVQSGHRTVSVETALGVLCDPEKITSSCSEKPADFDAFWDGEKAELYKLPICASNIVATKKAGISAVTLECLGGRPCTGYYMCPTNAAAKTLPAKIFLPGWNPGQRAFTPRAAPTNRIEFVISIHGTEMERDNEYYKEFFEKNTKGYVFSDKFANPKDTSLYGIVMRTLKAIQFLKTRPEWNGELEVTGYSQGGFLTLMSAALDQDVTKAVAVCPWLCDFDRKPSGGMGGWTPGWNTNGAPYYLTCNFTPRIKCPVEIRGGLVDRTCSPAGLLAAWHLIPGDTKSLRFYQRCGHGIKDGIPEKDILTINN